MAEISGKLFKDIKKRPHQRMPVTFSIKSSCNISRTKIDMFQDEDSDGQGSSVGGKGSHNGTVGSGSHKSSSESPKSAESSRPKMSYNLCRPQTATCAVSNDLLKPPSPKLPPKLISNLMEPTVSSEKCLFEKSSLILDHGIEDLEAKLEAYNKEFQKNKMLPDSAIKLCQQSGMNGQGSVVNLGYQMTKGDEHHFTASRLNRNIFVSEIKSPSNFFIQFCKSASALNDLEKAMESEYEGAHLERLKLRREDIKEGLYIVCRHSGQWRRAQIIKKVGDAHAKVLHIDFGCEQIKCHDEIFFLLDKPIFKIAAMAFPATLHNIKPVGILDWMNASTRRFTTLVTLGAGDMLVAKYHVGGSMTDPTYQLSLSVFLKKGEVIQVGDKLIEEMLAEAATHRPKIAS